MAELYAQILFKNAQKEGVDPSVLVQSLVKHLRARGQEKLLPAILRELTRLEARAAKLQPLVEVAHEHEAKEALAEAAKYGIHAEKAQVNPTLVTGWRAGEKGKLIDQSGKRALVSLYQKIIAS